MEIRTAVYVISSPGVEQCPPPDKPEFAFIGRSNVGKSSLINLLVDQKNLAKTSSNPGKTKLINHFLVTTTENQWYLVDLPGYGFAKVSLTERKKWEKMIREYILKRENLVNIFVLIDSRHQPQQVDFNFISKLGEWKVPFSIVFTKTDKETQRVVADNINAFKKEMSKQWAALPPTFSTSAEKKLGRDKLLTFITSLVKPLDV